MKIRLFFLFFIMTCVSLPSFSSELYSKHHNRNGYLEMPFNLGFSSEGAFGQVSVVPVFKALRISPLVYVRLGGGKGLSAEGGWGVRYMHTADTYFEASKGDFGSDTEIMDGGEEWEGEKYHLTYYKYLPGNNRIIFNAGIAISNIEQTRQDDSINNTPLEGKKLRPGFDVGITFVLF